MHRPSLSIVLAIALTSSLGCDRGASQGPAPSTSSSSTAAAATTSASASSVASATSASGSSSPSSSVVAAASGSASGAPASMPTSDSFDTSQGPLVVTPIYHATMLLRFAGKNIYVDPAPQGQYANLPLADVIFVTDIHPDHLDAATLDKLKQPSTLIVAPPAVAAQYKGVSVVMKNGDARDVMGVHVEAVPMYNLTRGPAAGKLYHDKGRGNGYVLTFGDRRVYLSGDTECTDEMRALKNIDVAFVCMNLPYTMPPTEAAECVRAFHPKVVFPYHFRDSNLADFTSAIPADAGVEVRIRKWY